MQTPTTIFILGQQDELCGDLCLVSIGLFQIPTFGPTEPLQMQFNWGFF
jgi:hypothetical protein